MRILDLFVEKFLRKTNIAGRFEEKRDMEYVSHTEAWRRLLPSDTFEAIKSIALMSNADELKASFWERGSLFEEFALEDRRGLSVLFLYLFYTDWHLFEPVIYSYFLHLLQQLNF